MKFSRLLVGIVLFTLFLSPVRMSTLAFQDGRDFSNYLGRGWINNVLLSPQQDRLLVQTWLGLWLYEFPSMELLASARMPPEVDRTPGQQVRFSPTGDFIIVPVAPENINRYGRLQLLDGYTLMATVSGLVRNNPHVSPDGWLAAYTDENDRIKLVDAITANELATLDIIFHARVRILFSPDSRLLARAYQDIEVWDLTTYSLVATLPGTNFAFSPDNQWFATSGDGDAITLWSLETYTEAATIPQNATHIAFSPDGKTLVALNDERITLWDTTTLSEIATWPATSFVFSAQGQLLFTQSQDNTVVVWDMEAHRQLGMYMEAEARHRVGGYTEFAFSPDEQILAIEQLDGPIILWNMVTHSEILIQAEHVFAFSPDGQLLITEDDDFGMRLWDVASGTELGVLAGPQSQANKVIFSPPYLLILNTSGSDILWEVDQAASRVREKLRFPGLSSLEISPDGQLIRDNQGILNLANGERVLAAQRFDILPGWEKALVYFTIDDTSEIHHEGVRLWDIGARQEITVFEGHQHSVSGLVTTDETYLITYSLERLQLWDLATGEVLKTFDEYGTDMNEVVFSPDGRSLFSAEGEGTVGVWDVDTGNLLRRLEGHHAPVRALALSPDGTTLASGDTSGIVKLWDVTTGTEIVTLTDHWRSIHDLDFSSDGQLLASAGDETLFLWDVASGTSLTQLGGRTTEVAFSPDGQLFATVEADQRVTLWDVQTRERRATLLGHTAVVTSIAFSPNGQILASGDMDGIVKLWDIAGQREIIGTEGLHRSGEIARLIFSPNGGVLMILSITPRSTNSSFKGEYSIWGVLKNQQLQGADYPALVMAFSSHDMLLALGTNSGTTRLDEIYYYDEYSQPAAEVTQTLLCRGYGEPRLMIGQPGQVLPGDDNSLNSAPARASQSAVSQRLGSIPAGATFMVLDGPVCGDGGIVWWQVDYNGTVGWTGEGQGDAYWVQPYDPDEATATSIPVLEPTATDDFITPVEVAQCTGTLPHRLVIGGQGRVLPGDANLINSNPARLSEDPTNQRLGQIPGGGVFDVIDGPVCNGDIAWWQVEYEGVVGWTGEGQGDTYWVEPVEE